MACVYKRTTQKGHTWYIQYRDSEGKKIRKATEAKTKREAEDELADALIAIKRGQNQCDEGSEAEEQQSEVLFFKICDDFMEYSPAHKRSWWRDEYTVRRLKAFFGNIESSKIQKLSPQPQIGNYLALKRFS
jgi:hypothetical protein